ncbi:MAG: hypothetical protein Q9220_003034 [cf. Caloplaca sp. 1 TL-2023]
MDKKRKLDGELPNDLHPSKKYAVSSSGPKLKRQINTQPSQKSVGTFTGKENTSFQSESGYQSPGSSGNFSSVHVPSGLASNIPASQAKKDHETQKSRSDLPDLPSIKNPSIAEAPFTHSGIASASISRQESTALNYERLEFLGDAYIELIASRVILARFPNFPVGMLSQTREHLVRNKTLANFSRRYGFDTRARIPPEMQNMKGADDKKWIKILGDIFEAYVAAVIVSDPEHGFATAEKWLTELWEPLLLKEVNPQEADTDAKQILATKIMTKGTKMEYLDDGRPEKSETSGQEIYRVSVCFTGLDDWKYFLGTGTGLSKRTAGQEAARKALRNSHLPTLIGQKKQRDMGSKILKDVLAVPGRSKGD